MNIESGAMIIVFSEMFKILKKNKVKYCKMCFTTDNLLTTNNQSGEVKMGLCVNCKDQYYKNVRDKQKQNLKEKYGVEYTFQLPGIKEKIQTTMKEKYGVENYFEIVNQNRDQFPTNKEKKPTQKEIYQERFGDDWYQYKKYNVETPEELQKAITAHKKEKSIRRKNATIEKFGVENISQLEEVKEKKRQKALEKYGVENVLLSDEIKEKIKETNLERYGSENVFGSEEIKEKIRGSNLERYGVEHPLQNPEILKKAQQTNLERYGNHSPAMSVESKEKTKQSHTRKYGVSYYTMTPEFIEKIKSTSMKNYGVPHHMNLIENKKLYAKRMRIKYYDSFIEHLKYKGIELLTPKEEYVEMMVGDMIECRCLECGKDFEIKLDHHQRICCNCTKSRSSYENKIIFWLNDIGITNIVANQRYYHDGRKWYDIDILLPDFNVGIEFHGMYYHRHVDDPNEIGCSDPYRCQKKYLYFEKLGIRLIQIFEIEYVNNEDLVKSLVLAAIGKSPRNIDSEDCRVIQMDGLNELKYEKFANRNHLRGYRPVDFRFGLVNDDELVAALGLRRLEQPVTHDFELIGFCEKKNCRVFGAIDKMIYEFLEVYGLYKIVANVDVRFENEKEFSGWSRIGMTEPRSFHFLGCSSYLKDEPTGDDFEKIYDSGCLVFEC
jgi:hypothetical protein